jgi:hypothetical protein
MFEDQYLGIEQKVYLEILKEIKEQSRSNPYASFIQGLFLYLLSPTQQTLAHLLGFLHESINPDAHHSKVKYLNKVITTKINPL